MLVPLAIPDCRSAALGLLAVLDRQIPGIVAETPPAAEAVVVEKAAARLSLLREGRPYRSYPVALGASPRGHKQRQGDGRTPEGRYVIGYREDDSQHYKALHISYPNAEDRRLAAGRGEDPGGMIMIHGQPNGLGWLGWLTRLFQLDERLHRRRQRGHGGDLAGGGGWYPDRDQALAGIMGADSAPGRPPVVGYSSFLWAPSQKGLSPLRLQPHSQTFSCSASSTFIGVKPVSLWEPSQKGWFLDRPQLHHQ